MKIYTLHREQFLPISLETAWSFFSTPKNLAKITPDMGFNIITPLKDDGIHEGMNIEYTVKPLFGIKMKWITEIGKVLPPQKFTDRQLKGPYALWEHTHIFKEQGSGVQMIDEVRYALPFGIIGQLGHALLVKGKLKYIFDFRAKALQDFFG